ncbi:phage Tail Collar Domain protein [Kingella oralis ATCC 51147]|uniref:Phage Tail Collar Domain protein n=2 Tax=Kingella TaxID=32257 RepID=C4GFX3_9NEIS|nr:phage Tail Collar Domain protein [Kingella oralis ATCC 51147]
MEMYMAISTLNSFNMAWGENGGRFDWQPAQYRQGWATIGDVPPSVEQFNALHYLQDEKANFLYRQLADVVAAAGKQYTETEVASLLTESIREIIKTTIGETKASSQTAGIMKVLNTLGSTATDAALSAAQGKALNDAIAALNALLTGYTANSYCPSGQIGLFATDYAPTGWLKANGAVLSRTVYTNLFAAIGTRFGAGDGHSTFNLPDLRGEFPRFWDDGRGVDAGRVLGSWQSDAIRNITAQMYLYGQDGSSSQGAFGFRKQGERGLVWSRNDNNAGVVMDFWLDASKVVPTAHENRPRNIALLACIKI